MLDRHPITRSPGSRREQEGQVRTACQECSVACGLVAGVNAGRIVDVQGDEAHPISRGRLCARGTAFVQGLTLAERLTRPAVRNKRQEAFQALDDWKSGLDLLAERLRQLKERHGPDSLLIGCDREGGLDFYLGALRFAQLWGTSQVVHSTGRPVDPWPDGLDAPTAPCSDWIHSKCLFLVEADLAATHPVAFAWVQEAQRRGARVIAADARFTATLAKADHALRMKPAQGNLLGLALAKLMLEAGGEDARSSQDCFIDAPRWRASFEQMSLVGDDAELLGISLEKLRHLSRLLSTNGPVTVITGRGLANHPHHRIWLTLAAAMGWTGQRGGGWYPLEAGVPPLSVNGDPRDAHHRPGGEQPAIPPALSEVTERGQVQAVICSGNGLFDGLSPLGRMAERVDLVVHFGAFPNATWERASLTFPAALWAERDGLVFGDDRTVEWGARIVEPPAGCRSGLDFWTELARRFGWEAHFPWTTEDGRADPAAFCAWLLAQSPLTAGLELDDLRNQEPGSRIFWPVGEGAAAGGRRPWAGKIAPHLAPAALSSGAGESGGADYPLTLLSAQSSCRSGDASRFWPWTRGLASEDAVQINPETAGILGIENGDEVTVDTPHGDWQGRAHLSRVVPPSLVASLRGADSAPIPALVHRNDQSPDDARNLLKKSTP